MITIEIGDNLRWALLIPSLALLVWMVWCWR